ncbi:phage tail terminator-like protein [Rodentibacter caecimuris]|uniref:phage tail terminator-like protein n=1 Tax=Rodentibacter caecimuris TaxID=1796644 RepID=UPI002587F8C2|nr:phage tail terminator-like protein [Rodentibacter heylii]
MKAKVRSILQTHLSKLGEFNTAWEGIKNPFTLPYQTVWLTVSATKTGAISSKPHAEESGFMQVTLYYPAGNGTQEIEERASQLQKHFYGQSFIKENVQVVIHSPPVIGGIFLNDDKLALPITINYSAYEL